MAAILLAGLVWTIITPRLIASEAAYIKTESPVIGYPAPDFQLQDINGYHYKLSDFRGKVIIVNFWASWCTPCKVEMPAFQSAADEYRMDDVVILGINVTNQDSIKNVMTFLQEKGITFPILLDQSGSTSSLYQVFSMPTTFFIDPEGIIRNVMIGGPISKAAIRAEVRKMMDK